MAPPAVNHEAVTKAVADSGLTAVMPERMSMGRNSWQCFSRAKIVAGEIWQRAAQRDVRRTDCISIVFASLKMNWTQSAIIASRARIRSTSPSHRHGDKVNASS